MLIERAWLLIILTWIAIVIGGVIYAVIEDRKRNKK